MNKIPRPWLIAFILLAASVPWLVPYAGKPTMNYQVETLRIETGGRQLQVTAEIARTTQERSLGLMYRERLAPGHGMLFLFDGSDPVSMWMKNTRISLDMMFIDSAGRILYIAPRTTPGSHEPIGTRMPVRAVLEMAAGTVETEGIQTGDRVIHPEFFIP